MILVGTVCHPPSSFPEINQRLLQHIQQNVQLFYEITSKISCKFVVTLILHFPYNRTICKAYD